MYYLYSIFIYSFILISKSTDIEPFQVYSPSLCGISSIKAIDSDGISFLLVFSGSTDIKSYSSNMMIYDYYAVQYSSTSDYPNDRSYYGMAYSTEYYDDFKLINAIVFGGLGANGVQGDFWMYFSDYDFWYELDIYLPESAYNFAYTSYYDQNQNLTRIFVVGGINNLNEYVQSANEFVIENEEINWLNDYVECTTKGLAGSQLIYSDNSLYLFSGYSYNESVFYFNGLCKLDLTDINNPWESVDLASQFGDIIHGGSCLYENSIYYFFGSTYSASGIKYSDKIYKLKLDQVDKGWEEINFKCPDGEICARDSFGYACFNNEVTIIGGKTALGVTNSMFSIEIDKITGENQLSEIEFPNPRAFASLTQSSTKLLLFGGINKEKIFNDLWQFEYNSENKLGSWTALSTLGSSPEPRYGHAAATQGIFTIIIGGTTYDKRILSDIWLLNSLSNTWTNIIPSETSSSKIPSLTRSCAMFDLPKFYFLGGKSLSGSNFDLWEYDLSTNKLTNLIKSNTLYTGTHGHACQLIKEKNQSFIYSFYGLKNDMNDLFCGIRRINITDKNNIIVDIIKEKPDKMQCRGNFAFSYNGMSMLIIGGEVFPDFVMKDIWMINFTDTYGEKMESSLYETLSGSSMLAFSDQVFVFSGYHDGSFSVNSDLSSSLYLTSIKGNQNCGFGYNKTNEICEPCSESTYKPTYDGICLLCPPGTSHNLQAATDISQCTPCPKGKYYDKTGTNQCINCPIDFICPAGSAEPLNISVIKSEQQSQPKNFIQPSMGYSMTILGSVFGFSILIFIMIFSSALFTKVVFSVYELYKADHIIPRGETSYKEDKTKISFFGGFFSGLAIIVIIFNFALFIVNYIYKDEDETRSLVPMVSLVQEHDYVNNHLVLEVYMYSYRDECMATPHFTSSFFNLTYAYFDEKSIGEESVACTHVIDVDFNKLFTTGASIDLSFFSYTSDISLTISGKSGNPGAKSSYTQTLTPTDNFVFKGLDPSIFSFNIMPSYYNYKGFFGEVSESIGFRVSSFVSPISGSIKSLENIYLSAGFNIKIEFIMSESGMTTYRFHQIDPISLIILMLASVPGLIGLFRSILIAFEKFYYKCKKIPIGVEGTSAKEQYNKLAQGHNSAETDHDMPEKNRDKI
ncbi:hypothetical protein SteCoe_7580 [Stentor coeruleus]|uniref:Tyrosine-protein kinase ephrin type A/B receptor-like domain-containing protein n=1 Tax=Stentor coeruleus TaxID=5963 RepID=A0A1R2CM94_9CILI|nr:hypothetical protein SteCoe_7580 [Stentor coeruleus]